VTLVSVSRAVAFGDAGELQGEKSARGESEHQEANPDRWREIEHSYENDAQDRDDDEVGQQGTSHQVTIPECPRNLPWGRP
jgi:hypothetical protein